MASQHTCQCTNCAPSEFPQSLLDESCQYVAKRDTAEGIKPVSILCNGKYHSRMFAADECEGWIAVWADIEVVHGADQLRFDPHVCTTCHANACARVIRGHVQFVWAVPKTEVSV